MKKKRELPHEIKDIVDSYKAKGYVIAEIGVSKYENVHSASYNVVMVQKESEYIGTDLHKMVGVLATVDTESGRMEGQADIIDGVFIGYLLAVAHAARDYAQKLERRKKGKKHDRKQGATA